LLLSRADDMVLLHVVELIVAYDLPASHKLDGGDKRSTARCVFVLQYR